jgi:hypothetical protein
VQLRTPPVFMDVYILHSPSTVTAHSSAGCYFRSLDTDIWLTGCYYRSRHDYLWSSVHTWETHRNCPSFVRTRVTVTTIVLRVSHHMTVSGVHERWMSGHHDPTLLWTKLLCLLIPVSLFIFSCATKKYEDTTSCRYTIEKMWKFLRIVGNWNFPKIGIFPNLWEIKIPISQRLGIFKITTSWQFNETHLVCVVYPSYILSSLWNGFFLFL